ncbi:MAG: urease accessory protein UreD [Chloroflexi bacterium]|uniref:urease accessory protein UreD n=1 Tax=Candidatus Flexifilum breve TaxID=3140694 RepID=UPI003136C129|nr:urease accessory protein UreD [Chloroflexota bacterium]
MSLHSIGREGELRLSFARRGERTILAEQYSRPPLQVMRAIPDAAGILCVYLLSPTGGVVQGDRYRIDLEIGDEARALFTTQSATKIYRMPEGCAEQVTTITARRGAFFEYVPDAAILFADADYHQRTEVTLEAGALALLYDIVMPGRLARGERLQFRRFANRTRVSDARGLLVYDAADIQPAQLDLDALGRLEGYPCWGSATLVGDLAAWGLDAAALATETAAALSQLPKRDGIGGASLLARNGLSVRVLSQRLETIYEAFSALRLRVRDLCLHSTAPLRK